MADAGRALGWIALLAAVVAQAAPPMGRPVELEDALPRFGLDVSVPEAAVVPSVPGADACAGGCRELVFRRPTGCTLKKRIPTRKLYTCSREEQRLVTVSEAGVVAVRKGPTGPARNPYPLELVPQWRYCPFQEDSDLERLGSGGPATLEPYEDPDVGRCYVLRPALPPIPLTHTAHLKALDDVHPYLRRATEQLIRLAAARGAEFKVISTNRPAKRVTRTVTRKVKVGRRWKTVEETVTRYKGGGWHAFGLAVDINLSHRKDLGSATSAYLRGGPEREAWLEIGAQGEAFGLIWIGRNDPGEIFHFEWHPGWPGMPKGALYQGLASQADARGIPSIWEQLIYDPKRPTRFAHLADPVAPGRIRMTAPASEPEAAPPPKPHRPKSKRRPKAKVEKPAKAQPEKAQPKGSEGKPKRPSKAKKPEKKPAKVEKPENKPAKKPAKTRRGRS